MGSFWSRLWLQLHWFKCIENKCDCIEFWSILLLPGHKSWVRSVLFRGSGEKIQHCRGVSHRHSKNPQEKWFFWKSPAWAQLVCVWVVTIRHICFPKHKWWSVTKVSHDAGEEKKVQNRKESHFCGTCSQGGESKRRLLAITDRVCCLMLCLVTVWRSCGYTKFAVGEESGLVAGRVRGCSCSHHIWGLRGQMCARWKAQCKNQHLEDWAGSKTNRRVFWSHRWWLLVSGGTSLWLLFDGLFVCGLLMLWGLWMCDKACGWGADSGFLPLVSSDTQLTAELQGGGRKIFKN